MRRLTSRAVLTLAFLILILTACGNDGSPGPLRAIPDTGSSIGAGAELNGPGGTMVWGELRLVNESDSPAIIDSVTPVIGAGSMQITRLGLLDRDRPTGSFDNQPGPIVDMPPRYGDAVIDVDDLEIPPTPIPDDEWGYLLLVEYHITGDSDLYFAGFDVDYTINGRSYTLEVRGHGFAFCRPEYTEDCGEFYKNMHFEKYA